jgi:hypothetical protein
MALAAEPEIHWPSGWQIEEVEPAGGDARQHSTGVSATGNQE